MLLANSKTKIAILITVFFIYAFFKSSIYQTNLPGIDFYIPWSVAQLEPAALKKVYSPDLKLKENLFEQVLIKAANNFEPALKTNLIYWFGILDKNKNTVNSTPVNVFTATPIYYSLFSGIKNLSFGKALRAYQIFSGLVFLLGCWLVGRSLNLPITATLLVTGLILFDFRPLYSEYDVANFNRIQFGLVSILIFLTTSNLNKFKLFSSGLLISLLILIKPNFILIAIAAILPTISNNTKDKITIFTVGILSGLALAFLFPILLFSDALVWFSWISQSTGIGALTYIKSDEGNFSLLPRILQSDLLTKLSAGLAITAMSFICFITSFSKLDLNHKTLLSILLAAALTCLLGPLAWYHYYLILVLDLFLLMKLILDIRTQSNLINIILSVIAWILLYSHPYFTDSMILKQSCCQIAVLLIFCANTLRFYSRSNTLV